MAQQNQQLLQYLYSLLQSGNEDSQMRSRQEQQFQNYGMLDKISQMLGIQAKEQLLGPGGAEYKDDTRKSALGLAGKGDMALLESLMKMMRPEDFAATGLDPAMVSTFGQGAKDALTAMVPAMSGRGDMSAVPGMSGVMPVSELTSIAGIGGRNIYTPKEKDDALTAAARVNLDKDTLGSQQITQTQKLVEDAVNEVHGWSVMMAKKGPDAMAFMSTLTDKDGKIDPNTKKAMDDMGIFNTKTWMDDIGPQFTLKLAGAISSVGISARPSIGKDGKKIGGRPLFREELQFISDARNPLEVWGRWDQLYDILAEKALIAQDPTYLSMMKGNAEATLKFEREVWGKLIYGDGR